MQGNHLFEYAVIRIMPKVEREEFLNVGVILYCQKIKFLQVLFTVDERRLSIFAEQLDIAEITAYLNAFEQIALGSPAGGPIGKLDVPTRFRWLTATRSTVIQTSKVHTGFCNDPLQALIRLHAQLVL
ncbi:DUF3037 domain-containing protein [Chitinophaga pendula]|uniref:DUF3037 domain-containing protein n=1 Tax=Chitinophaga TaxID=79328 RepID=UPI000BAF3F64|nr:MULTISPECIES: DUF3037 domain-containing protein [Chitinophaga]ASZ09821.1 hypothetical protein CK934_01910 [Chitinophaga sp. MD30]UCJ07238.1 DUF3037 domain-containing protein [Chitinophaga pendula]